MMPVTLQWNDAGFPIRMDFGGQSEPAAALCRLAGQLEQAGSVPAIF